MPAFRNSLHGALPPTFGWSLFLAGAKGPASMAICASCLVGDDLHDPLLTFLTSSLLLFILPGVGGPLSAPVPGFSLSIPPAYLWV